MLVKDGVIEQMFVEPDKPGDPFEVSDADTMLAYVNPDQQLPPSISIITKPGCPHCKQAKSLLVEKDMPFEEIVLGQQGVSTISLAAISGRASVPQVFIDGKHVGGAHELTQHLVNPAH